MKITKAKYNWLVAQYNYRKNKEQLIEISDEEYERLTGEIIPQGPTDNTEPELDNPISEIQYDYTGYDFGVGPFAYGIDSLEDQTVCIHYVGDKNITEINLPSTVMYNNKEFTVTRMFTTFENCQKLNHIIIPNTITHIDLYSFYNCNSLTEINIPSNVITIGLGAFEKCCNLKNIIISEGVKYIEEDAFRECDNLINIHLPNSIERIDKKAFYLCKKLTNINIPNNIKYIGISVWSGCDNLHTIIIPNINIPSNVDNIPNNVPYIVCLDFGSGLNNFITYSSIIFDIYTNSNMLNIYCLPELIEQYTIKYEKEIFLGKINILDINTYTE